MCNSLQKYIEAVFKKFRCEQKNYLNCTDLSLKLMNKS